MHWHDRQDVARACSTRTAVTHGIQETTARTAPSRRPKARTEVSGVQHPIDSTRKRRHPALARHQLDKGERRKYATGFNTRLDRGDRPARDGVAGAPSTAVMVLEGGLAASLGDSQLVSDGRAGDRYHALTLLRLHWSHARCARSRLRYSALFAAKTAVAMDLLVEGLYKLGSVG